jgi:hypothetical protein
MADCQIFKRNTGRYLRRPATGRAHREWVGICSLCGETCFLRGLGGRTTRKTAKDALHRHMLTKHQASRA